AAGRQAGSGPGRGADHFQTGDRGALSGRRAADSWSLAENQSYETRTEMRSMKVGVVGALAALVNLSATAGEGGSRVLDSVVVTATGQSEAVRDVQASVEVIDRERIDRYADGNVPQLLMHAAGVQASNGGATGDVA